MSSARRFGAVLVLLGASGLAGCGEGGLAGGLRQAGVGASPDEFLVLPTRPLELPPDLTTLPPPIPGAMSRVDVRPRAEAVAGLTGRTGPPGVAAAPALVARAGPVDPAIRARLAAEDRAFRSTSRPLLLERLIVRDRDALVYRPMVLDPGMELDRLRAMGVQVPAAPPPTRPGLP